MCANVRRRTIFRRKWCVNVRRGTWSDSSMSPNVRRGTWSDSCMSVNVRRGTWFCRMMSSNVRGRTWSRIWKFENLLKKMKNSSLEEGKRVKPRKAKRSRFVLLRIGEFDNILTLRNRLLWEEGMKIGGFLHLDANGFGYIGFFCYNWAIKI